MKTQAALMIFRPVFNGIDLMGQCAEYNPPEIKAITEEVQGGRFSPVDIATGLEKMKASLKLKGVRKDTLNKAGVVTNKVSTIKVGHSYEDEDAAAFGRMDELTGTITSIVDDPIKKGELPGCTIEMTPRKYKRTEDGTIIYNLNNITQEFDFGDGDIMKTHRKNVGMPA